MIIHACALCLRTLGPISSMPVDLEGSSATNAWNTSVSDISDSHTSHGTVFHGWRTVATTSKNRKEVFIE